MDWLKFKHTCKKIWYFIWEDDSWASWFVNVVLAFVLIKFIVYPGLGLLLSTSHPIVAVVSGSMEHDGSFDDWWSSSAYCGQYSCSQGQLYAKLNITKDEFRGFSLHNGFNKGDIMILYRSKPANVDIGDVIVYMADRPDPIIHRVIMKKIGPSGYIYMTKGDHNPGSFDFEAYIPEDTYIGKAVVRVPLLGYIKIGFVRLLQLIGLV
jgi:hypothetical protein